MKSANARCHNCCAKSFVVGVGCKLHMATNNHPAAPTDMEEDASIRHVPQSMERKVPKQLSINNKL